MLAAEIHMEVRYLVVLVRKDNPCMKQLVASGISGCMCKCTHSEVGVGRSIGAPMHRDT